MFDPPLRGTSLAHSEGAADASPMRGCLKFSANDTLNVFRHDPRSVSSREARCPVHNRLSADTPSRGGAVSVRLGSVADIELSTANVRFVPEGTCSSSASMSVMCQKRSSACIPNRYASPARKANYHSTSGGHLDVRVASPGEGPRRLG